jgi:hypothetical protein
MRVAQFTSMMALSSIVESSRPPRPTQRHGPVAFACDRIHSEYLDMPGLCLTLPQAMRLWSLDRSVCARALKTLVRRGVLQLSPDGMYRAARL